ncbi:GNAT family N-acetyltransferase [Vibrio profundum]|uniref:GNAT family N-acetyltransferase n=1 Tax=Vibrio profundum TaxID=2910247 RepID=UPI003D0DAD3A
MMPSVSAYLSQFISHLHTRHQRYGVVMQGSTPWLLHSMQELVNEYQSSAVSAQGGCFQLGGEALSSIDKWSAFNKGKQLLGQECGLLICDFRQGFDANSFNSALGTLMGGGLLVIVVLEDAPIDLSEVWLHAQLDKLLAVSENHLLPELPTLPQLDHENPYKQQSIAITAVVKVATGRSRRPLILTADRGRGKSSALGIASAQLMQGSSYHIAVTAPRPDAVATLFSHARAQLGVEASNKPQLNHHNSSLTYVAPDELLRSRHEYDLVFVDEASAIPLPMLKAIVERNNRVVFSTTVHGYEGCGRGFTLKFQTWLKDKMPATRNIHLTQAIRWSENDWLEQWQYQAFMLDCTEVIDALAIDTLATDTLTESNSPGCVTRLITKQELLENISLFRSCFSLLVQAHYQTTPNDLFTFLRDDKAMLFATINGNTCLACILAVEEGGLSLAMAGEIQSGRRRPKGHLVPATIVTSTGIQQALTETSLRIMRIAVHPEYQQQGLGTDILTVVREFVNYDFYSVSFGATPELVRFWSKNRFLAVKIGSRKDTASGTYSLVMVHSDYSKWIAQGQRYLSSSLPYSLTGHLSDLEPELVRTLLPFTTSRGVEADTLKLVGIYASGGSNIESVAPWLNSLIFAIPAGQLEWVSDLLLYKVVLQKSWAACCEHFSLLGRKQAEQQMRKDTLELLSRFTL